MSFSIFVPGKPQSKGSWVAIMNRKLNRPIMIPDNKRSRPWEKMIAAKALYCPDVALLPKPGALVLSLHFYIPRPKSVKVRTRPHVIVKPDLDKLIRCVLDALTGIAYVDDSQVVSITSMKVYDDDHVPGVQITGDVHP